MDIYFSCIYDHNQTMDIYSSKLYGSCWHSIPCQKKCPFFARGPFLRKFSCPKRALLLQNFMVTKFGAIFAPSRSMFRGTKRETSKSDLGDWVFMFWGKSILPFSFWTFINVHFQYHGQLFWPFFARFWSPPAGGPNAGVWAYLTALWYVTINAVKEYNHCVKLLPDTVRRRRPPWNLNHRPKHDKGQTWCRQWILFAHLNI